jgi:hypothetical protein
LSNDWQPEPRKQAATKEEAVNSQGTDPRMMEALDGASSLQLYQLKALIEGMLADPRRGMMNPTRQAGCESGWPELCGR